MDGHLPLTTPVITTTRVVGHRGHPEDRVAILPSDSGLVLVVADGAGGMGGGAEAADLAIRLVSSWEGLQTKSEADIRHLLVGVDVAVADDPAAGETTVVVVEWREGCLFGASVGDSGAWLVTRNAIEDLTAHQRRKPLLGSGEAQPVAFATTWKDDATLIMATDGLLKYVPSTTIQVLSQHDDLEQAATLLVDAARLPSGGLQDDIGIILFRSVKPLSGQP